MNDKEEPEIYEFLRLPFGNASSPFGAQYVLQTHAKARSEEKPNASETIDNSMYVDDVLDSCETVKEACSLRNDLSDVLSDAGFKLWKWLSNEPSVIVEVPVEDRAQGVEISDGAASPVKAMTIPRLELVGAVVATRLAKNLTRVLNVESVTFWVDSTNVLYWIRNQSRNFKAFVASRVGEIQRSTNPDQWRHIPGESNPADLPTRGLSLSASQLSQCQTWTEGPEFLKEDESTWPEKLPGERTDKNEERERRTRSTFATGDANPKNSPDRLVPDKFSSLSRLLHVTAWIRRFLTNCKLPKEQRMIGDVLGHEEISNAETYWVRRAQTEAFPSGEKEKSLGRFCPRTDEAGLLRVNGRLRFAKDLAYDAKYPIILPKDHPLTRLIIVNRHEKIGHNSGAEHLLTEVRSRFWVIKGRRTVRNIVEKCLGCRRLKATPTVQRMAPLSKSRLELPLRAFDRIGTDYGGPFYTKQGRRKPRAKRYMSFYLLNNSGGAFRDDLFFGHRSIPERFHPDDIKKGDSELRDIRQWYKFRGCGKGFTAACTSVRQGEDRHCDHNESSHRMEI